ncbi:MAG: PTS transporter subunit EIIC [Candidatus Nanopelagicales bacterium]
MANQENLGFDTYQVAQTAAVIGQIGAVVGVFIRSRNRELRGVAGAAGLTGFFGITEPAVYGVTLRLKSPFIAGCTAGATGAVVMSFFGTKYFTFAGLPAPLTIINSYDADHPSSLPGMIIGSLVARAVCEGHWGLP